MSLESVQMRQAEIERSRYEKDLQEEIIKVRALPDRASQRKYIEDRYLSVAHDRERYGREERRQAGLRASRIIEETGLIPWWSW
jgi:hypothetical protein